MSLPTYFVRRGLATTGAWHKGDDPAAEILSVNFAPQKMTFLILYHQELPDMCLKKSRHAIMAITSASTKTYSDFEPRKLFRQLDFAPVKSPPPVAASQPIQTVENTAALSVVVKPGSPKPEPPASLEDKDRTPKKQKLCNCKNSRCLKLYCECFASGIYCDGCNCLNCHNNAEHENARKGAVEATLERNPNAFRPKIANSQHGSLVGKQEAGPTQGAVKHNKGCNCKRSGCLKKYCECFQANVLCSDNCKCVECKNFEGSKERRALFHGGHENVMVYQAANAAINGAIGSSGFGNPPTSRKRRNRESPYASMYQKQPFYHNVTYKQGNQLRCSTSPVSPEPTFGNAQVVSKVTYRSPLAGVIQPQDVRQLCSLLVMVSKEAAKTLAASGKNNSIENQGEKAEPTISHDGLSIKSDVVREPDTEKCISKIDSTNDQAVGMSAESCVLDDIDLQYGRPTSPGTLALMCYEQDTMFMEAESSDKITIGNQNAVSESSSGQFITEAFAQQEQMVLTKFRDFLNRLITCGSIKETMCSSLANEDRHVSNGFESPVVQVTNHSASKVAGVAFGPSSGLTQSIGHPIQDGSLKPKIEKAN